MYIFPFTRIRYIKTITINTHIDCLNNSKCSVGDILLATKQGAFESVFGTFSVIKFEIDVKFYVLDIKLVLNRDKTRLLLLIPLNYNGPPGSSLSVVCLFFLNAS